MALKSIGILVALCATLAQAIDREVRFRPEHEYYHQTGNNHHESYKPHFQHSSEESGEWGYHGFPKPHFPHSSEESGEWGSHGFPKPHFSQSSEESGEWGYHGFPKPHFPHSSEESGEWGYHGFPKPHFSHSSEESGEWGYHGFPKPHFPHTPELEARNNYGHAKPDFPNNVEGLEEHHSLPNSHATDHSDKLGEMHSSQEHKKGHKIHRPDFHNPHFQKSMPLSQQFEDMERRRPLFYPIYPYHPFFPHGNPANNDEEFETIEALKSNNYQMSRRNFVLADGSNPEDSDDPKYQKSYYHGHHNPNFPIDSDTSDNAPEISIGPSRHGFSHPHFNPFHKEPGLPEEKDGFASIITEDLYVNGEDFPASDEVQPYVPLSPPDNNEGSRGSFFIVEDDKEHVKLPPSIPNILEHLHHGHGKPHHHGNNKPNEDENENETDEEGSGEEEIIPLFAETYANYVIG